MDAAARQSLAAKRGPGSSRARAPAGAPRRPGRRNGSAGPGSGPGSAGRLRPQSPRGVRFGRPPAPAGPEWPAPRLG
eukprot:12411094-Alexandrium_andersonii.AAC.1